MNRRFYVCPTCKRPSSTMTLTGRRYRPTSEVLLSRPYLDVVGAEILSCPCGRLLTWFEMEKLSIPPLLKARGVTGTKSFSIPHSQVELIVDEWLETLTPMQDRIINGVCTGLDGIVGRRAHLRGFEVHGVVPFDRSRVCPDFKEWCSSWEEMPEGTDYMDRNDQLVAWSDDLTAFPRTSIEELRSGTWATVRRAQKKGIPVTIIPLNTRGAV